MIHTIQAFINYSTIGVDTEELDLLSRAQAIMKNIKELVSRKLELTDRIAENQEIMRLVVSEVCKSIFFFQ